MFVRAQSVLCSLVDNLAVLVRSLARKERRKREGDRYDCQCSGVVGRVVLDRSPSRNLCATRSEWLEERRGVSE